VYIDPRVNGKKYSQTVIKKYIPPRVNVNVKLEN
jgi:hypothetical protein